MNRYYSVAKRNMMGMYSFLRLKTKTYRKEILPQYDFSFLQKKWPYTNPGCVSTYFPRLNHLGRNIDLSICIPMYNVENSVITLLQQIEQQNTSYSIEVILVDDGSKDKTLSVVKDFISGKDYYHLFAQDNAGLSEARNTAINNASGRYITFIDSDDEVCDGFIENLMLVAISENAEIVRGKYYLKRGKRLYPRGIVLGYAWGAVFLNSLFTRVRFPSGYWYEDMVNSFLLTPLSKKTVEIDQFVIIHNDVDGSLSKTQASSNSYRVLQHLYLVMSLAKDYKALGIDDADYLSRRLMTECSRFMVRRTKYLDNETRKQVFLACNELFVENNIDRNMFSGLERIFVDAILD